MIFAEHLLTISWLRNSIIQIIQLFQCFFFSYIFSLFLFSDIHFGYLFQFICFLLLFFRLFASNLFQFTCQLYPFFQLFSDNWNMKNENKHKNSNKKEQKAKNIKTQPSSSMYSVHEGGEKRIENIRQERNGRRTRDREKDGKRDREKKPKKNKT